MKAGCKSKVLSHLKGDIKTFKSEAAEDRELIGYLKKKKKPKTKKKPVIVANKKMAKQYWAS